MDWQPIETAPKDGTHILAVSEAGYMAVTFYVDWSEIDHPGEWQIETDDCYNNSGFKGRPTHWMALPQPPTV